MSANVTFNEHAGVVGHRQRLHRLECDVDASSGIRSVIVDHRSPNAPDRTFGIDRDLESPNLIALLRRGNEMLATIFNPLDGTPEQDCRERHDELFAVEYELRAESSSDIRGDDAYGFLFPT